MTISSIMRKKRQEIDIDEIKKENVTKYKVRNKFDAEDDVDSMLL